MGWRLGDTYLISTNLVSSFRVGANRTNIVKVPDNYSSWRTFGANVTPLAGNIIAIAATAAQFAIGGGAASPGQSHNGPLCVDCRGCQLGQGIASDRVRRQHLSADS